MPSRWRLRDTRVTASGTYTRYYLPIYNPPYVVTDSMSTGTVEECTDVVGSPETDNPFLNYRNERHYPVLDGDMPTVYKCFSKYPIGGRFVPELPTTYLSPKPNWSTVASEAAARTNPSRPHIGIPTFLGELKDLPAMLRSIPELLLGKGKGFMTLPGVLSGKRGAGLRGLVGRGASANLAYRFGWRPFAKDLLNILSTVEAVSQRLRLLERLKEGRSIKKRYLLPTENVVPINAIVLTHTEGVILQHRRKVLCQGKSWVSTRWVLSPGTSIPQTDADALLLAWRLAYGITSNGALQAAWELLPWSWLIDWFGGLGNWLGANDNSLPLDLVSICWMRTSTSLSTYELQTTLPAGLSLVGEYWQTAVHKERVVIPPLLALLPPLPCAPALSAGRLSILASLLAQARRL